jgi:hypothetical protein
VETEKYTSTSGVGVFSLGGSCDQYAMRFLSDRATTPGDSDGWRLKGCAAAIVVASDQASFRQTENRSAARVSPCGSSPEDDAAIGSGRNFRGQSAAGGR